MVFARTALRQAHLDDLSSVLMRSGEALLDLAGLRPDAAVDELLFVVGEGA